MNEYVSLTILTAVIYDYVLMFSREMDYVWHRPWTWVSTMFVLVRYLGLSWAILAQVVLGGSIFLSGPVQICSAIYQVATWAFPIFIAAADLVMILRVYAMWNQSKRILYILLFIYIPQVIVSFVFQGVYNHPNTYLSVTVVQVIDVSFCNISYSQATSHLLWSLTALRFVFAVTVLMLAVISTLKESIALYKATKQWQPNRYMQQLVKDGILYFLVNIIYNIALAWLQTGAAITSTSELILALPSYLTLCPIMPRFIVSIRELYDRDLHGRWQGIDTGFGVLSQPFSSGNTAVSAIEFADVAPEQEQGQAAEGEVDDSKAIRFSMSGDGTHQV